MVICRQMILFELLNKETLVSTKFVLIYEVWHSESSNHAYYICFSREYVTHVVMEIVPFNTLLYAFSLLATRTESRENFCNKVITVGILIFLSTLKLILDALGHVSRPMILAFVVKYLIILIIRIVNVVRVDVFVRGIEALKFLCVLPKLFVASNTEAQDHPNQSCKTSNYS